MKKKEQVENNEERQETVDNTTQQAAEETQTNDTEATQEGEMLDEWAHKYVDLNNSHLRLMADFDNYRKRTIKEKADLIKNAGERLIIDLLPLVDNFDRALKSMESAEDVASIKTGIELIYNQLMGIMKSNGVAEIATEGADFDTEFHEAITTIPAPTPELKDKIVDCTTKGYTMNEKVIRHSKVVVGA